VNLPLVRALKIPGTMAFRQASFGRDTLGRLCRPKDGEPQAMQTGVYNPRSEEESHCQYLALAISNEMCTTTRFTTPGQSQQRDLDSNNKFLVQVSFRRAVLRTLKEQGNFVRRTSVFESGTFLYPTLARGLMQNSQVKTLKLSLCSIPGLARAGRLRIQGSSGR